MTTTSLVQLERRAPTRRLRLAVPALALVAALAIVTLVGCGGTAGDDASGPTLRGLPDETAPGTVPDGALDADVQDAVESLADAVATPPDPAGLEVVATSQDLRGAWVLLDLLRLRSDEVSRSAIVDALAHLTAAEPDAGIDPWLFYGDLLLAWDVPAPPGYDDLKRQVHAADGVDDPLFASRADLDWRGVLWSGVDPARSAALVDPEVVVAEEGTWLPDSDLVVGVDVAGEVQAFPLRVLQVHPVVTAAVGGRRVAIVHCEACGASTAYLVDRLPGGWPALDLEATGFVDRGAPLLVERTSLAVVNGLTGEVVPAAGSEQEGLGLEREPVVVTTWGSWRAAHPSTAVVSEDAGTGRVYVADPLAATPAVVPAMPVGSIDGSLPLDTEVLGVEVEGAAPVAFDAEEARVLLDLGEHPTSGGVRLDRDAGGLVAVEERSGRRLPSHPAYWFAWSGAHPDTTVWPDD